MMKGMKVSSSEKLQSQLGFGKPSFVVDEPDGGSFSKADVVRKLPTPRYLKGSRRKQWRSQGGQGGHAPQTFGKCFLCAMN